MPGYLSPLLRSAILASLAVVFASAQKQASVQIISPKKDAVVHPGETFEVIVRGIGMKYVFILVQYPLETPKVGVSEAPYKFRLKVARDAELGRHNIYASGEPLQANLPLREDSIDIDVERADSPVRITAEGTLPFYLYVGESDSPTLIAHYQDGTEADIDTSVLTHCESSRPDIAWVSGTSLFAHAPGEGVFTITNGRAMLKIPFVVKAKRE